MKEKMKFPDGTILEGQIKISGPLCTIRTDAGHIPEDTNLIQLISRAGAVYGRIEGYTTLYQLLDDGVTLSSDGSVYVEPESVEPYVPTLEELQATKREAISAACQQAIYAGIDVSLPGGTEHFALRVEDQINLFGKQAQLAAGAEMLEYHADGEPCRYFSAAEMQMIITVAMAHVSLQTTRCNSFFSWIEAASAEELETISYGADIPEQYQSEVLRDYIAKQQGEVRNAGV